MRDHVRIKSAIALGVVDPALSLVNGLPADLKPEQLVTCHSPIGEV